MAAKTDLIPKVLATHTGDDDEQQLPQGETTVAAAEHQEQIPGKPKKVRTETTDFISEPTVEEILARIPAKTAFCCKVVSKPWLSIVNNPIFARTHFSRAPVCPLLISSDGFGLNPTRIMHLFEGRTVSDLDPVIGKSRLTSRFEFSNIPPSSPVNNYDVTKTSGTCGLSPMNINAVSCEGILCWVSLHNGRGQIILCNPITSEYFPMDPIPNEDGTVYIFIGMGFVRATKKFEVLRMSLTRAQNDALQFVPWVCEVLTIGDTHWRNVGFATDAFDVSQKISDVVYVNCAIYWRYLDDVSTICSFDFDTHIFRVIRVPRINPMSNYLGSTMSLGVLANSLCVSLVCRNINGHASLWVLKCHNNNNVDQMVSWRKICDVASYTPHSNCSGVLGLSRGQCKAIKYLDSGEILMYELGDTFLIYDPVKRTARPFRALERSSLEGFGSYFRLQVVPHVPCLVKLKEALSLE